MDSKAWNLVADIGGTNARFGLVDYASARLLQVGRYSVAEHDTFSGAMRCYLRDIAATVDWQAFPRAACLAVACPVDSDVIQFTNSPWTVNRNLLSGLLDKAPVALINDFAAVGYAVTDLHPQDWCQLGGYDPTPGLPIAVLGPGTGLGVCSLVSVGTGYQVIEGEGGHVDFAPVDAQEVAVLQILTSRFGRVSAERLLSGAGLLNIYQSLAQLAGKPALHQTPAGVSEAALAGVETLAVSALGMFCRVLGSAAGNLALTLGAKGGLFVAGGIAPRIIDFLGNSEFRRRFESKGRFASYLRDIPVRVVVKEDLGLFGAVKKLTLAEL